MTQAHTPLAAAMPAGDVRRWFDLRVRASIEAGDAFFAEHARSIAACAAAMADRFFEGGALLIFGGGAFATDAQHNSVEYVHPVLPGCRALPALSLVNDVATVTSELQGSDPDGVYARQLVLLGRGRDMALGFSALPLHASVARGLAAARGAGMLTIALTAGPRDDGTATAAVADHHFSVDTDDRLIAQELHLATYHMLWELVHIVLNHRGIAGDAR